MRKSSRLTTLSSTTTALIDIITTGSGNNDDNGSIDGDKEPLEWWIIALAVGASVLFIILVILIICLCRKRKQGKYEGAFSLEYFNFSISEKFCSIFFSSALKFLSCF